MTSAVTYTIRRYASSRSHDATLGGRWVGTVVESPGGACTWYSTVPDHPGEGTAPTLASAKAALEAHVGGPPPGEGAG